LSREETLGLNAARRAGLNATSAALVVFIDDDNVIAPNYLELVVAAFDRLPRVGALGGRSAPEFEEPPQAWQTEFFSLLALRDLGPTELVSGPLVSQENKGAHYPGFAPIGAGMAVRREACSSWLRNRGSGITDRRGNALTSGGDNELVFAVLESGWQVAYVPELKLTHLIPASRLSTEYLARLNRSIQKSWMQVLTAHRANPWSAIPAWTVGPRKCKAWFNQHAWADPASYIRWQGACGHFEGRTFKPAVR